MAERGALPRPCGCPECVASGESHGPTCGCRACNPDGTFFADPSMPDGYCQVGVYAERLTDARDRALEMLSMTQCPYFDHEGKCDRGCYSEPACITDAPTEGWVGAAINALAETLPADEEADSVAS